MIHHVSNSHFSDFSYWQFMIHLLTFIPKCLSPIILTKIHPLVHSISICISEREWLYKNIISLSDSKTKNKELLKLKCSVSVQVSNSLTSFFSWKMLSLDRICKWWLIEICLFFFKLYAPAIVFSLLLFEERESFILKGSASQTVCGKDSFRFLIGLELIYRCYAKPPRRLNAQSSPRASRKAWQTVCRPIDILGKQPWIQPPHHFSSLTLILVLSSLGRSHLE